MTTKEPVTIIAEQDEFDVWLEKKIDETQQKVWSQKAWSSSWYFGEGYLCALRAVRKELEG